MSGPLLAFVTLIYIGVAVSYWMEGRDGMAFVFVGYALANVGLIADGMKS
jgi:hypothetical protein